MSKICDLCKKSVDDSRSRANINSVTFPPALLSVYMSFLDTNNRERVSDILCRECVSKLRKFSNAANKLKNVQRDIVSLLQTPKVLPGMTESVETNVFDLPIEYKSDSEDTKPIKRCIPSGETPVPRVKVRKISTSLSKIEETSVLSPGQRSSKKCEQTVTFGLPPSGSPSIAKKKLALNEKDYAEKNTKVTVTVAYPSQTRRFVPVEKELKTFLMNLVARKPRHVLVASIVNMYKSEIFELMLRHLNQDIISLCAMDPPSVLQSPDVTNLLDFKPDIIINEWEERAKLFVNILRTVVYGNTTSYQKEKEMAMAGSIMLFSRNRKLSAMQRFVGLALHNGGTSDKAITMCNHMGLSVSSNCILKKKREIEALNSTQKKELISFTGMTMEAAEDTLAS
ncbi:uncharacterized protein LOC141901619 [Tubulanus polymorphus]|uniref:uncharacterized protein LOC141901619 n=1 Tax=Tubulanus polymorphus TaxID=672921 RepID=UPI003DA448FE